MKALAWNASHLQTFVWNCMQSEAAFCWVCAQHLQQSRIYTKFKGKAGESNVIISKVSGCQYLVTQFRLQVAWDSSIMAKVDDQGNWEGVVLTGGSVGNGGLITEEHSLSTRSRATLRKALKQVTDSWHLSSICREPTVCLVIFEFQSVLPQAQAVWLGVKLEW